MKFKRWFVLSFCLLVVFYCNDKKSEYITWTDFKAKQYAPGHFIILLKGQRLNGKLIRVKIDTYVFNSVKEKEEASASYKCNDWVHEFYEQADMDSLSLRRLVEANIDNINRSLVFLSNYIGYRCHYVQFLCKDNKKIELASKEGLELEDKLKKQVENLIRSKERLFPDIKLKKKKKRGIYYSSF